MTTASQTPAIDRNDRDPSASSPAPSPQRRLSLKKRMKIVGRLLLDLRPHDVRAARTFVRVAYGKDPFPARWIKFLRWSFWQMFVTIPQTMSAGIAIGPSVSRTAFWLESSNPLLNHPWAKDRGARLPEKADTVVIGAGFTGGAAAYHWARRAPVDRSLVVLEMGEAASGASGRNQGTIVMGRYFAMVRDTVADFLPRARPDLARPDQIRLAEQFADAYCSAAERNADLIQQTVREHGFDVDYARNGWVQERLPDQQELLRESAEAAKRSGHTDWISIDPERVMKEAGMRVTCPAGFSQKAGTWHPAKWVWSLLTFALRQPNVSFFSRTRVIGVEKNQSGEVGGYIVRTDRGDIRAAHVLYAVESYLPKLDRRFHDVIEAHQEQSASGVGGPRAMPSDNSITGRFYFGGRRGDVVLVGSDSTHLPDRLAGSNRPSRFLTKFALSEYRRVYGPFDFRLTNEWSGTVGYTPDQYPLIGSLDNAGLYMIGGMCGSGSGVAFNAARCIVNRILALRDEPDDYPEEYFAPSRLLDPDTHRWPQLKARP